MTISSDLFMAILAMDAYNRGYNEGLIVPGTQIGLASLGQNSLILTNILADGTVVRLDQPASFFAQAYTWNGQTVISYRGTDQPGLDIANGYGLATGNSRAPQGLMALDFYRSVIGLADPQTANVVLTGHSLGGGLATLC